MSNSMTFLIIQHFDLKIEHTSFRSMDTFGGKTCIRPKRTAGEANSEYPKKGLKVKQNGKVFSNQKRTVDTDCEWNPLVLPFK